jgi:hypothetical protein
MSFRPKHEVASKVPEAAPQAFRFSFGALAEAVPKSTADTEFYMSAPPGEKYVPGQLLGIVINNQHVHTGRTDPHVLAVRNLLKQADEAARNPNAQFKRDATGQITLDAQVAGGQYTHRYLYTLIMVPEMAAAGMQVQGFRMPYHIRVIRRIGQYQAPGSESEVYPLMVGNWGNVVIDPDGGGVKMPPGYGGVGGYGGHGGRSGGYKSNYYRGRGGGGGRGSGRGGGSGKQPEMPPADPTPQPRQRIDYPVYKNTGEGRAKTKAALRAIQERFGKLNGEMYNHVWTWMTSQYENYADAELREMWIHVEGMFDMIRRFNAAIPAVSADSGLVGENALVALEEVMTMLGIER